MLRFGNQFNDIDVISLFYHHIKFNNGGGGNNSGNNSGGGNNTNNTCGNDPNLTDLMVYIDPSAYVNSGDPVYAYYDINCTIPNTNYTLEVSL